MASLTKFKMPVGRSLSALRAPITPRHFHFGYTPPPIFQLPAKPTINTSQHRPFSSAFSRMADQSNMGGPNGHKVLEVPSVDLPSAHQDDASRQKCLIFFIPGNPGLVTYYTPFLTTLRSLLDEAEARPGSTKSYHIYAQNLLGFSDTDHAEPFGPRPFAIPPFTLEDQIVHISARVTEKSTTPFSKVLLIGHSVGAYIAIETLHRYHLSLPPSTPNLISPPTPTSTSAQHSAILLFPTISHIALSPNGRHLSLIATTPFLDRNAHRLARFFLRLLPAVALSLFLRIFLRMPKHAVGVTTAWLKSRDGVWQALHMGKDEMRVIGEEEWVEGLWEHAEDGSGDGEGKGDKFVFLFGKGDRWVAEETRDAFIKRREEHAEGRTRVVVDQAGIPHAFCLSKFQ